TTIGGIWMTGTLTPPSGTTVLITRSSSNTLTLAGNTINSISGLGILVDNSDAIALDIRVPVAVSNTQEWRNTTENTVAVRSSPVIISGAGDLTLRSTGSSLTSAFRFDSRANTFTGQLTIAEGNLRVTAVNNVSTNGPLGNADASKPVLLGDSGDKLGYLRLSDAAADVSTDKPFTLTTDGRGGFWVGPIAGTNLTLNGKISGGGTLVKMGAGDGNEATALELTNSDNEWTGGTLVTDGYISISAANRLGDGAVTLDYDPDYVTNSGQGHSGVAGLKFTGTTAIDSASRSIVINSGVGGVGGIIDVTTTDSTLVGDGALSGAGALTKAGSGSLTLTGDNSGFTGSTTVANGTLLVNGTHTGGGQYTVESGGKLGGNGDLGSSHIIVNSGGTLAPGVSIGSFSVGSAVVDGTLSIEFGDDMIDNLLVANSLDLTNTVIDFSALGDLSDGEYTFAEFDSVTLPGGGLATLNANAIFPANSALAIIQVGNELRLDGAYSTMLPGDFNEDGFVDAADYVVWRKTMPGNMMKYDEWRSNFGTGMGGGASINLGSELVAGIPEPASLGLLLWPALGLLLRGRRHRVGRYRQS
ncbi:MAG: autotransporter-associated beta strand repeat-containing protein, partial [Pirellulales bacterium]